MSKIKISTATKSKVITKSGFKNYDVCANSYVGCQFGCSYCYVRFFVKDKDAEWGKFVRIREHIKTKFPKELELHSGKRLVIGTMTDPYQPEERKHRLTRFMLESIIKAKQPLAKVGIFTRSPIIIDDIDLIKQLPKARVHYTISPYNNDDIHKLEPIGITISRRIESIKLLKQAGIRVHANVAPAIPLLSESTIDEIATKLADANVDEFFVDPMQAYGASFEALRLALQADPRWGDIEKIMKNKDSYQKWKTQFHADWEVAWKKQNKLDTLPIWSDHENHVWVNMNTNESMDPKKYGDELETQTV